jgi:hypothetical protein
MFSRTHREEIEHILHSDLSRTRAELEKTRTAFLSIVSDTLPDFLNPSCATQATTAEQAHKVAFAAYAEAVKEFNEFVLHGKIPERLLDQEIAA